MKRLYLAIITSGLLLVMPALVYAADAPPVGQALVREGDYAVELVKALNINAAQDEAAAESALATLGIAPQTGWISDFPVTPDIIAQVQASVDEAAATGRLPISRDAAGKALIALNDRLGLAVIPASDVQYAEQTEADQADVDTYYNDEGPPVITYYEPPPDYAYLYAWDPYPFWCDGFFFPGYFILVDFDVDVGHHHRHHHDGDRDWGRVSNHIRVPGSGKVVALDPVSKHPLSKTEFRPIGAKSFGMVNRPESIATRRDAGTFNRDSASRLVNHGSGRIEDTRAVGRDLPASMCSIGNCSSRSTGSRSISSEGSSSGQASSGRGGNSGESRGYSEGRSSGSSSGSSGGSSSGRSWGGGGGFSGGGFGGGHSWGGGGGGFGGGGGGRR